MPGEAHEQRILAGYSLWGCKESDTTEGTEHAHTYMGECPGPPQALQAATMGAEVLEGWRSMTMEVGLPTGLCGWGPHGVRLGLAQGPSPHLQLLSDYKCLSSWAPSAVWAPTPLLLLAERVSTAAFGSVD